MLLDGFHGPISQIPGFIKGVIKGFVYLVRPSRKCHPDHCLICFALIPLRIIWFSYFFTSSVYTHDASIHFRCKFIFPELFFSLSLLSVAAGWFIFFSLDEEFIVLLYTLAWNKRFFMEREGASVVEDRTVFYIPNETLTAISIAFPLVHVQSHAIFELDAGIANDLILRLKNNF